MNCKLHPTKTSVTTCQKCGSGVCDECASVTAQVGNYCVKCAYNEIVADIDFDEDLKSKFKRNITLLLITWIVGAIMVVVGAILMAVNKDKGGIELELAFLFLIGGICISGIFSAIDGWRGGSKIQEKSEAMFGETYTVSGGYVKKDTGLGIKLLMAFYGLFFGLVDSPTKIFKYKKYIKEIDEELEEIIPIKTKLYNYYNKAGSQNRA